MFDPSIEINERNFDCAPPRTDPSVWNGGKSLPIMIANATTSPSGLQSMVCKLSGQLAEVWEAFLISIKSTYTLFSLSNEKIVTLLFLSVDWNSPWGISWFDKFCTNCNDLNVFKKQHWWFHFWKFLILHEFRWLLLRLFELLK